jgi:hypothetical protein
MVVTRSYASKYNLKLNNGLDNPQKNNHEYDNNYVFRFIYILFCFTIPFLLYFILVNYIKINNYVTVNKYLYELKSNKENDFILLKNNIPEKTFEYLSISLYDKLPAKSYENNYNNYDNIFNQFLYKFITEDRYNYYLNFFN